MKSSMVRKPRVGVGVIIEKNGQILLIKRTSAHGEGTWSTPGGHLEYGESPEACAIREVKEETGVRIGNVTFKGITNDVFRESEKHYVTIWMEGKYLSGKPVVKDTFEASDIGWFAWNALPKPLFLPLRHFVEGAFYPAKQAAPASSKPQFGRSQRRQ